MCVAVALWATKEKWISNLRPALRTAKRLQPHAELPFTRPSALSRPTTDILSADFSLLPQRGDKFGERLYFAVEDLFKCGFESVCLIDSDSPTVPAENFAEAVELLSTNEDRVVLGPSDDGGYYLIGVKKPHRHLFEQIDWSTERVLNQTMQRATEIGIEVKLLPTGYDVDDGASLRRLCSELLAEYDVGRYRAVHSEISRELGRAKEIVGRRSLPNDFVVAALAPSAEWLKGVE